MSQNINITLELRTVLTAIKNGETEVLAEVISKLLMADYEIFKQLNDIGKQLASYHKTLLNVQDRLINLEPITDPITDEIDLDEEEDDEVNADTDD